MHLVQSIKNDFPIFNQLEDDSLIYFDNAATTQKPKSVIDAICHYYEHNNANIGRSVYNLSMKSFEIFENSRSTIQKFINAPNSQDIVFTKGTTESINFIAETFAKQELSSGDEVIISGMEHHSNLLPWQRVCEEIGAKLRIINLNKDGSIDLENYQSLLTGKVKLVAVAHVSNVFGTVNPVKEMIALAHEKNIPVLVDGAQAVAHLPVDVQELNADFYCFSGHKMYGPMGIGVLYIKSEHQERMKMFQVGGGVAKKVGYHSVSELMPIPSRFEAGTPNVSGALGIAEAARYILSIGFEKIQDNEKKMFSETVAILEEVEKIEIYGDLNSESSIISFNVKDIHPYDIGNTFNGHNIAVRTGVHCAVPLIDSLELLGTVRISFGIYNSLDEIVKLKEALIDIKPMDWTINRPNVRFLVEQ